MSIRPLADNHMIWLGDFNRHHPLWDEDRNTQLFTSHYLNAAQPLLNLIADYGMIMMLPKGFPTFQSSSSKNWTCPDNIFCTDHTGLSFISCTTNPALRGPATDHVPILSILELEISQATVKTKHDFCEMDWEIFKDKLKFKLAKIPPAQPVVTDNKFQTVAHNLTTTIQDIIEQVLPKSKPNPHSKRWWTKDLTMMHCEVAKLSHLSYRNKSYANHYSHEEYCIKQNQYTKAINKTKKEHGLIGLRIYWVIKFGWLTATSQLQQAMAAYQESPHSNKLREIMQTPIKNRAQH